MNKYEGAFQQFSAEFTETIKAKMAFLEKHKHEPDCDGWPKIQKAGDENRIVYFVQCRATGLIKIGSSRDVRRRVYEIKMYLPLGISNVWWSAGGVTLEYLLHSKFEQIRIHGEWFEPNDEFMSLFTEYDGVHKVDEKRISNLRRRPRKNLKDNPEIEIEKLAA